jgi:flagellin
LRINHNIAALNTYRQLSANNVLGNKSLEKLSSGLRINRAGDDAAGLAISEKMRGQIRGLDQASRNAQDAISMIQTAEGALNETHSILQRMRELAVQAGNDTITASDRNEIQKEINQLSTEINRIGNTAEFNTQKLLNATSGSVTVPVPGTPATAGVYTVTIGTADITIDGETFAYDAGGDGSTAWKDAASLVSMINSNAILSEKYTAEVSGTDVNLTQNTGYESATEPSVSGTGASISTTTAGAAAVPDTPGKSSFSMQIGANENQTMTIDLADMRAAALGITGTGEGFTIVATVTNGTDNQAVEKALDVSTASSAGKATTMVQQAIDKVSAERSKLGACQNRLEHTINNLGTSSENLATAESRIRDVDMAAEMMEFTKMSILQQAATAMLAQANQQPQMVLQLLGR